MLVDITPLTQENQIKDAVGLLNQYMLFYGQPSDEDKYGSFLKDRLTKSEAMVLIAFDSNRVPIGFVLNYPSFSTLSQGKIFVLNDLFVLPEFRKKGV